MVVAILLVALVMAIAVVLDRKDKAREFALGFTVGLIDEAIAVAEVKTISIKREAVFTATKAWQKQRPEVLKDQIAADKFLQDAMGPARQIAHDTAKQHVLDTVAGLRDGSVKRNAQKMLVAIDSAIKIRITCSKINIPDPLRPFLYRYL